MQTSFLITLTAITLLAPFHVAGNSDYGSENEIDGSHKSSSGQLYSRPVGRCISSSDCGRNQCSVIGMQRYSEPRCEPLSGIGAPCRPGQEEGESKVLHFPHMIMECDDVHLQFCPCASGLFCQEGQCQPLPNGKVQKQQAASKPSWTFGRLH